MGVFDGVHRGHLDILRQAVKKAGDIRGTSMVLTFWPHPRGEKSIYSLEHRLRLIEKEGIDVCCVIRFSRRFSRISPLSFIRDTVCAGIGAKALFVGENFRFGKNAAGGIRLLRRLSRECGFILRAVKVKSRGSRPISSTYIRKLISMGHLAQAEGLLSRRVCVLGTVIRGDSLATRMGFPTANIDLHHEVLPPDGIYAARVVVDENELNGVCYIGIRPTVRKLKKKPSLDGDSRHVEVHIFDFKKNIYGKNLEIQFVKKIREDRKFGSTSELIEQIEKDLACAKIILSRYT